VCVYYLGLRMMKMKPVVKAGTILPIGKVVEIRNKCVILETNDDHRSEVSFADIEDLLKGEK
jgi:hypothetical protein